MSQPETASSAAMRDILRAAPVMPVVTIRAAGAAVPLAHALLAGGIRAIEITLRTPLALPAIEAVRREVDAMAVGAGTVLDDDDLVAARDAGASFAVSPGIAPTALDHAAARDFPYLPGIATASEAMRILAAGHRVAKVFPAGSVGGIGLLKALAGPFPDLCYCPTGGVNGENAAEYLALPQVIAVGGSWLAPDREVAAGDFAAITRRCRDTLAGLGRAVGPGDTGGAGGTA